MGPICDMFTDVGHNSTQSPANFKDLAYQCPRRSARRRTFDETPWKYIHILEDFRFFVPHNFEVGRPDWWALQQSIHGISRWQSMWNDPMNILFKMSYFVAPYRSWDRVSNVIFTSNRQSTKIAPRLGTLSLGIIAIDLLIHALNYLF
jgi:hypothetical protein